MKKFDYAKFCNLLEGLHELCDELEDEIAAIENLENIKIEVSKIVEDFDVVRLHNDEDNTIKKLKNILEDNP